MEDIVNDQLNDMEITVSWGESRPANDSYSKFKNVLTGGVLRSEVVKKVMIFENELNKQI